MNWRERILKDFAPQADRLTLVADPDGLLLEEGVLHAIRQKGFDVIPFEDPVAFRFACETNFRSLGDRSERTDLVVVLRSQAAELASLPFDLLQAGRRLAFSLGDLFPNLCYPVVAVLERADLDALYHAQEQHPPGQLGERATRDFLLRHVFEVAPELIKQPSDLLRALLRRHYQGQRVPRSLDARLIEVLRYGGRFQEWGLEEIVPDREAFIGFLQERWGLFLDRTAAGESPDPEVVRQLKYRGPSELPFDHSDVRVYIDTLFLEGVLRPVRHDKATVLASQWCGIGVQVDPEADRQRRLEKLLGAIETSVPAQDARHQEWFAFAYRWAELLHLWHPMKVSVKKGLEQRFGTLQGAVDTNFLGWMRSRYATMHNQPATPPVMVHHVPRAMAREIEQAGKVALVLADGLALDQWACLREVLVQQMPHAKWREEAVFAWVPTITSVSRQAVFAGKPPLYFGASIATTDKEEKLWSQFWLDQGLNRNEVVYARKLREDGDLATVEELLDRPKVRVAGLVVDKADKIMHGMQMGTAGMHQQLRQWAEGGFLAKLLILLRERGFAIWLTADHGNIEAVGTGRPSEGAIADQRGERVRVYPDKTLRARVKTTFGEAIEWVPAGLPPDFLPLLSPGRTAFVSKGEQIVAHGGIALEEVVVPLIRLGGEGA